MDLNSGQTLNLLKNSLSFLGQFVLSYLTCDLYALGSPLDWFWSKASKPCNHTSYNLLEM